MFKQLIKQCARMFTIAGVLSTLLLPSAASAESPQPLTPAFTYQGQLRDGSGPVNGDCDFQFSLWSVPVRAEVADQVGSVIGLTLRVTNGLFTAQLNSSSEFGAAAFTGEQRWLQTAVRCPAGGGDFTTLAPRQELSATPYALGLRPGAVIAGTEARIVTAITTAPEGVGLYGEHSATTGAGVGVLGRTYSTAQSAFGVNGVVESTNPGPLSAGVRGSNRGEGKEGVGVMGSHNGFGLGVYGVSSGVGVYGQARQQGTGTGVMAEGAGVGSAALAMTNGAIRYQGAGKSTATPIFIHEVTKASLCVFGTVLDNPYINGDPNAILLVTPQSRLDPVGEFVLESLPVSVLYTGPADFYNCPANRWMLLKENPNNSAPPTIAEGMLYNIMAVKP